MDIQKIRIFEEIQKKAKPLIKDERSDQQKDWKAELQKCNNGHPTFNDLITKALDNHLEGSKTKKDIGKDLGYKDTRIRNIINRSGKTTNRDLIISICVCANLTFDNTNFGLSLYELSPLNTENKRDSLICDEIDKNSSIKEMNKALITNGFKGLDIQIFKNKNTPLKLAEAKYDLLLEDVNCSEFPRSNDISMKYNPYCLDPSATAYVKKKNDSDIYKLRTDGKSFYFERSDDPFNGISFDNIDDCPEPAFNPVFYKLQKDLLKKFEITKKRMDDTKNYIIRYDCRVENGIMKAYAETFDYKDPDYDEYFQMVKYENSYTMTVTHNSKYLLYHLGHETYKSFYKIKEEPELLRFESIKDITNQKESQDKLTGPKYQFNPNRMIRMYEQLQAQLDTLLHDIKNGKIDVFDPKWYDDLKDRAEILGIDSYFNWTLSDDEIHYIPNSYEFELPLTNGNKRKVSFDDVERALRVGIQTYDDFQLILSKYSKIEDFIS